MKTLRYVGIDVDKEGISLAVIDEGNNAISVEKRIRNDDVSLLKSLKRLRNGQQDLRTCYEAGPCGYVIKRLLDDAKIDCSVIAPGLVPRKPQDHVKTNRRDAEKLARMLKAGELEAIHVPTPHSESVRDFLRAREDIRADLTRNRHRLMKFVLRHGYPYSGRAWGTHRLKWLKSLSWPLAEDQETFDYYFHHVDQIESTVKYMDHRIGELASGEIWQRRVGLLRCFRGIDTLSAMFFLAEIEDFRRFASAKSFMGYVGLGVREYSTGSSRKQGGITKSGNTHVRRILVESAWCNFRPARVGKGLAERRQDQPLWVIRLADKAMIRLHRRFIRLVSRGKHRNVALTAIARELAGFIWAAMTHKEN